MLRLNSAETLRTETHVIYIGDGIPTTGDADPWRRRNGCGGSGPPRPLGEGLAVGTYLPCRDHRQQLRGGRGAGHRVAGRRLRAAHRCQPWPDSVALRTAWRNDLGAAADLKVEFHGLTRRR